MATKAALHSLRIMCGMLIAWAGQEAYPTKTYQMAKPETITSAANPLVKDVRRAIVRGTLTESGLCVAETFHLLEEALRSDCEVKHVLASETVRSAAEAHVRGLA